MMMMMKQRFQLFLVVLGITTSLSASFAFAPSTNKITTVTPLSSSSLVKNQQPRCHDLVVCLQASDVDESTSSTTACWNPKLRRTLGTIAGLGALETAYLTLMEVSGNVNQLVCPANGSEATATAGACTSVLSGPYGHIPQTDIPLAALGFLAYSTVFYLAVQPILASNNNNNNDDSMNRILLTAATTTMGVFSVFLMSILFGVLHESCPYCIASAVLSIVSAKLCWIGGALPSQERELQKRGIQTSLGGGLVAFLAALVLFVSTDVPPSQAVNVAGELVTTNNSNNKNNDIQLQSPPPITTTSSEQALQLAEKLKSLNANFFGAFWCSHCYDQKETLGKEAMAKIPYIECARDGVNSQTNLCKSKKVPGYPTWEIDGTLYPGEQSIEELEEIVQKAIEKKATTMATVAAAAN